MLFFLLFFLSFSTLVFSFFILFLLSRWPFFNFSFSFFTPNSYLSSYAFIIFLFWKSFFLFGHFFFLFFFFSLSQCSFFKLFPLFFFITNSYFSTFLQLLQFSLFFLSCFFFLSCLKNKKQTKKTNFCPVTEFFRANGCSHHLFLFFSWNVSNYLTGYKPNKKYRHPFIQTFHLVIK